MNHFPFYLKVQSKAGKKWSKLLFTGFVCDIDLKKIVIRWGQFESDIKIKERKHINSWFVSIALVKRTSGQK